MKIAYVEVQGFRGFRERRRIDLPTGFAVITGRNGSGKSTLCDAVEFALTGTMRAAAPHKEKRETIRDYFWWRGIGAPSENYVEVGFRAANGNIVSVRRWPDGMAVSPETTLEDELLVPGPTLENPLSQLCRTMILRDEEITQLSVDLRETDRFEFVRSALGTADVRAAEEGLRRVADLLKQHLALAQREYDLERDRAGRLSAQLSEARAQATRASGVSEAHITLEAALGPGSADLSGGLSQAERALGAERARTDVLTRLFVRLDNLVKRRATLATVEHLARIGQLEAQLVVADREASEERTIADRFRIELTAAQQEQPRQASQAELLEHGGRLGLDRGRCPLCGTKLAEAQFTKHVVSLRSELAVANQRLTQLSRDAADAAEKTARATATAERLRAELDAVRHADTAILAEFETLRRELQAQGYEASTPPEEALRALSEAIETKRIAANRADEAVAILRASQAARQVVELDRESIAARERLASAEATLSRVTGAQSRVHEATQTLRRVQGELVDEQLAALTPLLVELYERLRPHVDWQKVRYNLRGDVRKMLSLEVGQGLNPNFIFSSGQRRAAGLAFLLAIHVSRSWCRLKTLILDDPIQHVDDYRALHLTEVLAAVRRTGQQVICTVEEPALAELLARRLRSDLGDQGLVVELAYAAGRGAHVAHTRVVAPLMRQVLVAG
jgi:DNA repair exonuclease SbcCD ATPase subunit